MGLCDGEGLSFLLPSLLFRFVVGMDEGGRVVVVIIIVIGVSGCWSRRHRFRGHFMIQHALFRLYSSSLFCCKRKTRVGTQQQESCTCMAFIDKNEHPWDEDLLVFRDKSGLGGTACCVMTLHMLDFLNIFILLWVASTLPLFCYLGIVTLARFSMIPPLLLGLSSSFILRTLNLNLTCPQTHPRPQHQHPPQQSPSPTPSRARAPWSPRRSPAYACAWGSAWP